MKRQILATGLLSLTAVSLITSCVDDKYDLSDIDTTSRFTVDNLTVPVKLEQIELKNVINFDDDDPDALVKEDPETKKYVLSENGGFDPTVFSVGEVSVAAPYIPQISINVANPLPSGVVIPSVPGTTIPLVASEKQPYDFSMSGIHEALKVLRNIKTEQPLSIKIELKVPTELLGAGNTIIFKNLELQLPTDLIIEPANGVTYDQASGILKVDPLNVQSDGHASITLFATGLDLGETKGKVENGNLSIAGEVGVLGGDLYLDLTNVTLPSVLEIKTDFIVSGFKIATFTGDIRYNMEGINSEIDLNDLPDFLDNEDTNIIIANPQIIVDINNPVAQYGLKGKGKILLTSIFKNDTEKVSESGEFMLNDSHSHLIFGSTSSPQTNVEFNELGYVLTNLRYGQNPEDPDFKPAGLPKKIKVEIRDIAFDGTVKDFPVSNNVGEASGSYEFKAPLGFGKGSKVVYESTESGWGSDELDKVNITHISLKAHCTTNLPVSVKLEVFPIDANGNEIDIDENAGNFDVPPMATDKDVELIISAKKGTTIKGFDGVRFVATVQQPGDNTEAIGPDLFIKLDKLSVTVAGYYDTDF